jgi:hypothetical protein
MGTLVLFTGLMVALGALDAVRVGHARAQLGYEEWVGALAVGLLTGVACLVGLGLAAVCPSRRRLLVRSLLLALGVIEVAVFVWMHPRNGAYAIDSPTKLSILIADDLPFVIGLPLVGAAGIRRRLAARSETGPGGLPQGQDC